MIKSFFTSDMVEGTWTSKEDAEKAEQLFLEEQIKQEEKQKIKQGKSKEINKLFIDLVDKINEYADEYKEPVCLKSCNEIIDPKFRNSYGYVNISSLLDSFLNDLRH